MASTKQKAQSQSTSTNQQPSDPYSNLSEQQVRGVLGQVFQGIPLSESAIQKYVKNPSALEGLTLGGQPMQGPGNQIPGASQAGYNPGWSGGQNVGTSLQMLNALGLLGGQQQPQGTSAPPPAPTGQTGTVMHPLQLPNNQPVQQFPQPSPPPTLQLGQAMPAAPMRADFSGMTQAQVAQQVGTQPISMGPNPAVQQFPQASPPPTLQLGQAMPVPPGIKRYKSGGMVQQNSGQVQQIAPGITRNAQGQVIYTDPALQTQLGLGDLTTSQQTALGLDPYHSQALSGATQVAAQYQPYLLGAAALNMPAVINLPPSGTPSSKSGVAATPGAVVGTSVPQTPQGPWLTNPSVFAKATPYTPTAAPTVTPQTPAAAVSYAPGQAFATPPAAPSSIPSSLPPTMAQSGATTTAPPAAMLPPGFVGGAQGAGYVPQAWQRPPAGGAPVPYTGTVHNDPYMSHAVSSLLGMSSNPWHPGTSTSGPGAVALATGPAPKQMQSGGMVPGRGNEDTVPALLTPGEYVIPKQQVAQLVARGALKMQSGGLVQDPDPDPPEARRQPLQVPAPASGQSSTPSAPSQHPGAARSILGGLQNLYQGGGGTRGGIDLRNTPADPDPDTPYLKAAGMGGGGGLSSPAAQNALGGVASGLNQAAQAIASSAQPWQMQQSAIPDPSQLPKYQTPTLQPTRT